MRPALKQTRLSFAPPPRRPLADAPAQDACSSSTITQQPSTCHGDAGGHHARPPAAGPSTATFEEGESSVQAPVASSVAPDTDLPAESATFAAPAPLPPLAAAPTAGLSSYEMERLANIERNNEVLRQLGLIDEPLITASAGRAARPKRHREPPPPPPPSSRTLRNRSAGGRIEAKAKDEEASDEHAVDGAAAVEAGEDVEHFEDEPAAYMDSSVFRYLCSAESGDASAAAGQGASSTSCSASDDSAISAPRSYAWEQATVLEGAVAKSIYTIDVTMRRFDPRLQCACICTAHAYVRDSPLPRVVAVRVQVASRQGGARPLLGCAGADGWVSVCPTDTLLSD